jgi:hypothetical protein
MTNHEELEELVTQLEEYCAHENDEHGEFVRGLCFVANYSYCMEPDFINSLTKQMEWELQNYIEHCKIVKTEETYTREYIELEWS